MITIPVYTILMLFPNRLYNESHWREILIVRVGYEKLTIYNLNFRLDSAEAMHLQNLGISISFA